MLPPRMMQDTGPAPSPTEVIRLQKALGIELPLDFDEFTRRYNGGVPLLRAMEIPFLDMEDKILRFRRIGPASDPYSLKPGELGDAVLDPENYLVFADTKRGNPLALFLGSHDYGAVYYVMMQAGKLTSGTFALQRCWRLYDSFSALCSHLSRPVTRTLTPDAHLDEENDHTPGLWGWNKQ